MKSFWRGRRGGSSGLKVRTAIPPLAPTKHHSSVSLLLNLFIYYSSGSRGRLEFEARSPEGKRNEKQQVEIVARATIFFCYQQLIIDF